MEGLSRTGEPCEGVLALAVQEKGEAHRGAGHKGGGLPAGLEVEVPCRARIVENEGPAVNLFEGPVGLFLLGLGLVLDLELKLVGTDDFGATLEPEDDGFRPFLELIRDRPQLEGGLGLSRRDGESLGGKAVVLSWERGSLDEKGEAQRAVGFHCANETDADLASSLGQKESIGLELHSGSTPKIHAVVFVHQAEQGACQLFGVGIAGVPGLPDGPGVFELDGVHGTSVPGAMPSSVVAAPEVGVGTGVRVAWRWDPPDGPGLEKTSEGVLASEKGGEVLAGEAGQAPYGGAVPVAALAEAAVGFPQIGGGEQVTQLHPLDLVPMPVDVEEKPAFPLPGHRSPSLGEKTVEFPPGLFGLLVSLGGLGDSPVGVEAGAVQVGDDEVGVASGEEEEFAGDLPGQGLGPAVADEDSVFPFGDRCWNAASPVRGGKDDGQVALNVFDVGLGSKMAFPWDLASEDGEKEEGKEEEKTAGEHPSSIACEAGTRTGPGAKDSEPSASSPNESQRGIVLFLLTAWFWHRSSPWPWRNNSPWLWRRRRNPSSWKHRSSSPCKRDGRPCRRFSRRQRSFPCRQGS